MESGSGAHHHLQYHDPFLNVTQDLVVVGGDRDRLPQWSVVETKELLALRWQLDQSFMETKRNKVLWDLISSKMKEKGFHRTPDQCKCKWKNLVTRYKGSEAMEAETHRQFPFQDDMKRIFTDRMERLLSFDDEEEEELLMEEDEKPCKKKRKIMSGGVSSSSSSSNSEEMIKNALRDFMRWQMQMEEQWQQASEAREVERRAAEQEWRQLMDALAAERAEMERRWREREEERRERMEERAERRHQLLVALLTKLINNDM